MKLAVIAIITLAASAIAAPSEVRRSEDTTEGLKISPIKYAQFEEKRSEDTTEGLKISPINEDTTEGLKISPIKYAQFEEK
ncbi:hypothetical protein BP5796_02903 [Coleophoma crateriformis]|uniref:Uncharacterized protein n=1 Tax=Coleophoma crateriformis TaxID=565419 RepID=A0A3D8T158_9HELO|nr:hypothetical protein BP5796_02903 [Coleophoma crateriformis]